MNTAGLTGSTITLYCRWDNLGISKVQWFNHIGIGSGIRLTDNSEILGDTNKYGLTGNHSEGEYNLQIKSLTDSDVGNYACFTQLNDVRYGAYVIRVGKYSTRIHRLCMAETDIQINVFCKYYAQTENIFDKQISLYTCC